MKKATKAKIFWELVEKAEKGTITVHEILYMLSLQGIKNYEKMIKGYDQ